MLMLDEKVLADFLAADLERNRKLDALIAALEQQKSQWLSVKAAQAYSGLSQQKLFYFAKNGRLRKRKISEKTFEYSYEDLKALCGN